MKEGVAMQIIEFPNQPVVGLKIDSKIQKEDIEQLSEIVDLKLQEYQHLGVYIEVDHFPQLTIPALIEDIKRFLPKFNRFKKKAVVGPKSWYMNIGSRIAEWIPGIEFQHFTEEQKEEAREWITIL